MAIKNALKCPRNFYLHPLFTDTVLAVCFTFLLLTWWNFHHRH